MQSPDNTERLEAEAYHVALIPVSALMCRVEEVVTAD
jgi:hypothetical protein